MDSIPMPVKACLQLGKPVTDSKCPEAVCNSIYGPPSFSSGWPKSTLRLALFALKGRRADGAG